MADGPHELVGTPMPAGAQSSWRGRAPRAVLFDAYETLIGVVERDSPFSDLIAAAGLAGDRAREAVRWLMTHDIATLPQSARCLVSELGADPVDEGMLVRVGDGLRRHLRSFFVAEGAVEVVAALRAQGYGIALVSNVSSPYKEPIHRLGIAALVDHVILSCEVGVAKPDAGIYRLALARLGLTPDAAVMVGDNLLDDVAGARVAGLHAIHLDPGGDARRPDTITRLRQLPDRVAALLPVETQS